MSGRDGAGGPDTGPLPRAVPSGRPPVPPADPDRPADGAPATGVQPAVAQPPVPPPTGPQPLPGRAPGEQLPAVDGPATGRLYLGGYPPRVPGARPRPDATGAQDADSGPGGAGDD